MTEQELFQAILQAEVNDRELTEILKKIRAGTADFQDTQRYSARCAEIEAKILSQNLSPAGTGQNEQNCQQLLENQFEDTIQKESAVQKALDQKQNIHIQPKKPKFPAVRVQKAAQSLEDETVSEDVLRRRAEIAVANIMNSFHDDYIRENADFRQKTGLKCRVSRIGASKCCPWCQKISGTFEVGHEPADFWGRHDNCTCQIIYENQKVRQRLSGSGRGWQVNSESQRRQAQRIQYKPTRFTQEQAQALESQQLSQYRGLTIPRKTGIINSESNFNPLSSSNVVPVLRKESEKWISSLTLEEIRAIRKYTKNDGDSRDDKFYARLNAMLRGEHPEDETLRYYAEQISSAIEKNSLEHDVLCYRTTKVNYFTGTNTGDIIAPGYFISTSVTSSGALNGNFKVVIHAPKGTNGAYIEKLSGYPKQREFLFDKNCKYKVISVSDDSMELEAIVWKR